MEDVVQEQYNQKAGKYDRRWRGYLNKTLSLLKSWAQILPGETVLDVACGTGELERLLLSENPQQKITGVDLSEEMVKTAKQKLSAYPQLVWKTAKASELPFDNARFDIIVCASAFHYFDEPLACLKETKRVLKSDGRIVILDWCKDYWGCRILDLGLKVFDPAYQRCYTQKELHDLLIKAGWEIRRHTKFRYGILWEFMVAEAVLPTEK